MLIGGYLQTVFNVSPTQWEEIPKDQIIPQKEQVKSQESIPCRSMGDTIIVEHLLTAYCFPCQYFICFVAEPLDRRNIRLSRKISLNEFNESSSIVWIYMSIVFLKSSSYLGGSF